MTGGSLTSDEYSALDNNNKVYITGGSIKSKDHTVYNGNVYYIYMSGGTITATEGIALYNMGVANISGGTFKGASYAISGSGRENIYSTTSDSSGVYAQLKGYNGSLHSSYGTIFNGMTVDQFNSYMNKQTGVSAGVTGDVFSIYGDEVFGASGAITIKDNKESYGFNIGTDVTKTFYGTSDVDNITVSGAAYIDGKAGNDIIKVAGENATINVSKGNDIIKVSDEVASFSVEGFGLGDSIVGLSGSITEIEGGIKVDGVSIYGLDAMSMDNMSWRVKAGRANYSVINQSGVTYNDDKSALVYKKVKNQTSDLLELSGMSTFVKGNGDKLISEIPAKAIAITAGNISQYNYTLEEGEYYIDSKINLSDKRIRVSEGATLYILDGAEIYSTVKETVKNYGTVYMSGGSITVDGDIGLDNNNKFYMSGGDITAKYYAVCNNNISNELYISGGTITATEGTGVVNRGKAYISGGTFNVVKTNTGFYNVGDNAVSYISGGTFAYDGGIALYNLYGTTNIYSTTSDDTGAYANFKGKVMGQGLNSGKINYGGDFNDKDYTTFKSYVSEETSFDIGGSRSEVARISENVVKIYDDEIFGLSGAVTVTGNEGSYGFNIGASVTGGFYGSSDVDTITVSGAAYIDGKAGNDIINVEGNNATINVSAGDDVITVAKGVNSLTVEGFGLGDTISGVKGTLSKTEGGILVGKVSICGISTIATLKNYYSAINDDSFAYVADYDSGVTLSGSELIMSDYTDHTDTLFSISGMSIGAAKYITLDGKTVNIDESVIKKYGYNVKLIGEGYTLNIKPSANDLPFNNDDRGDYEYVTKDNEKVIGSSKNDSITNTGNYVYINGGRGNDTITNSGAGVTIDSGTGNNDIYLKNSRSEDGTRIILGDGSRNTVHGFNDGFDGDIVQVNDLDDFEYSFIRSNLVFDSGTGRIKFDDAMDKGILLTDGEDEIRAMFAQDGDYIEIEKDNLPSDCYGKNSGVDLSSISETTSVNLAEGSGTVNRKSFKLNGINKAKAGDGVVALIGSDSRNVLTAGNGYTSMCGGKGDDVLIGRSDSEDKFGRTTFQFEAGDGHDVIKNFEFTTSENVTTADSISVDGDVNSGHLSGNDVVVVLDDDAQITIRDGAGKNIAINGLIAKVDRNLTFDGIANCYVVDGGSSLRVDSSLDSAEIWLDNSQDTKFYGDIRTLDASDVSGNTKLVGNGNDNRIIAGQGDASLWGGASTSNDVLIGGGGQNTFFYCKGNGDDTIKSTGDNDIVMLSDITLDDLASTGITENTVSINLKERGSLTVEGTTDVTYQLADGSRYTANHSTSEWEAK